MGFDGKTLIHPSQIEPCNAAFSPSAEEVAQARKIIAAFDLPENKGKGVVQIDGRMVERMHAEMARRTVAIAEAIGNWVIRARKARTPESITPHHKWISSAVRLNSAAAHGFPDRRCAASGMTRMNCGSPLFLPRQSCPLPLPGANTGTRRTRSADCR